jgi:hypothetical protein
MIRGPMSKLEQSISDMENDSEENIIAKGSDERA